MDVAITTFRAELATWINHVRKGEEVVITDRGLPIARLVGIESTPLIERLTAEGVISRPQTSTRPLAKSVKRVKARGSVSDLIGENRR